MEDFIFNKREKRLEPKFKQCAFCKHDSVSDMDDCHYMPIYKNAKSTNLIVYRSIEYSQIDIGVPRCNSCSKKHEHTDLKAIITTIILATPIFGISYLFRNNSTIHVVSFFIGLMVVGLGVPFLRYYYLTKTNFQNGLDEAVENDTLKDFLLLGWSLNHP
jgi:hypothetical protein